MLSSKLSLGFLAVTKFNLGVIAFGLLMCVTTFAQQYTIFGVVYNRNSTSGSPGDYINNAKVCARQGGLDVVCAYSGYPTSNSGVYYLEDLDGGEDWEVCVSKTAGEHVNGAITSDDATRISQHVAGTLLFPTNALKWAADVSTNLAISSTDAGMVTAFVNGSGNPGQTGTWRFYPAGTSVPWPTSDASTCKSYPSLSDNHEDDWYGILKGEVTGDWVHE